MLSTLPLWSRLPLRSLWLLIVALLSISFCSNPVKKNENIRRFAIIEAKEVLTYLESTSGPGLQIDFLAIVNVHASKDIALVHSIAFEMGGFTLYPIETDKIILASRRPLKSDLATRFPNLAVPYYYRHPGGRMLALGGDTSPDALLKKETFALTLEMSTEHDPDYIFFTLVEGKPTIHYPRYLEGVAARGKIRLGGITIPFVDLDLPGEWARLNLVKGASGASLELLGAVSRLWWPATIVTVVALVGLFFIIRRQWLHRELILP